jgi:hypothetical protein
MGRVVGVEDIRNVPDVHFRLPDDTDEDILLWALGEGRASKVVPRPGSIYKARESYVLLAACQPDKCAFEKDSGGVFTTALVDALRMHDPVLPAYSSLIRSLLLPANQKPLCEGDNQDKQFLSATNSVPARPNGFNVIEENGRYYIQAGELAGVVMGTELMILSPPHKIPVTAVSIEPTRCVLQLNPLVPDAKAYRGLHVTKDNHHTALRVTKENDIYYINAGSDDGIVDGAAFTVRSDTSIIPVIAVSIHNDRCAIQHMPVSTLKPLQGPTAVVFNWNRPNLKVRFRGPAGIPPVPYPGSLFTVVNSDEGLLVEKNGLLTIQHPLITKCANPPLSIDPKDLIPTINAISCFTFYLDHSNLSVPRGPLQNYLGDYVTVKLQKLRLDIGKSMRVNNYIPVEGSDIAPQTTPEGPAEFVILDTSPLYGLAIENHSEYRLFVYAFYFDPADYSINVGSLRVCPRSHTNDGPFSAMVYVAGSFKWGPTTWKS